MGTPSVRQRLVFIDIARSLAILLMLEGHFIALTLATEYRSTDFFFYNVWQSVRCITAPLFFTISGLVFTYLLSAEQDLAFWHNKRLKKGIKRSLTLLFWGYLLLINVHLLIDGRLGGYVFIFHVLQCIGVCITIIILLFIFQRIIRIIPLSGTLFLAGLFSFALKPTIYSLDFSNVHPAIENIFVISNSDRIFKSAFPLLPWVGFVLFGGAIGAYIRKYPDHVYTNWFPVLLLITALLLNLFPSNVFSIMEPPLLSLGALPFASMGYYLVLFGRVIAILAVIILIGKHKRTLSAFIRGHLSFLTGWVLPVSLLVTGIGLLTINAVEPNQMLSRTLSLNAFGQFILFCAFSGALIKVIPWNYPLFLKIGQNTLSIFIIHVIVLYGGIIGFGLDTLFKRTMNPWIAIAGAGIFLLLFAYYVKHLDVIRSWFPFKKVKPAE